MYSFDQTHARNVYIVQGQCFANFLEYKEISYSYWQKFIDISKNKKINDDISKYLLNAENGIAIDIWYD